MSSLSFGVLSDVTLFDKPFLDFFDYITGQIIMPIGALLTCLLVGWYMPKTSVYEELTNRGTVARKLFPVIFFAIRYICPICITLIFLNLLGIV